MTYRPEIDGLRALALLPVIFFHAGFKKFQGGFVGVDVFFVISGHLISSIIIRELQSDTFSLMTFYERRARRILPALFLVMICCIPPALFWLLPLPFEEFAKSLISVCSFSSNFLFWIKTGYFQPTNDLKPLIHTWSLAVEEQFYLIFPLLLMLVWKWKRKGVWVLCLSASALSLGIMRSNIFHSPDANYYLLPARTWEFLIGVILTLIIQPIQQKNNALQMIISQLASFLGIALLLYSLFYFDRPNKSSNLLLILTVTATALLILFATQKTLVGKFLSFKPLVGIGLISYSGYLWHQPVFAFTRLFFLREIETPIYLILIVINFILSYFSWRFIEQPFRKLEICSQKLFLKICVFCSGIIIFFGWVGISHKGLPNRFSPELQNIQKAVAKSSQHSAAIPGGNRPQYEPGKSPPLERFIDEWKREVNASSNLIVIPLAIFGSSMGADLQTSLERQGFKPTGLFGSGCSLDPRVLSPYCLTLGQTMYEYIQSNPKIKYLALVDNAYSYYSVSREFYKKVASFWSPLNVRIIIFSPKPHFSYFTERLGRGEYPKPELEYAEYGLRDEVKSLLASLNIHLVDSKNVFCKVSETCDFKIGPKSRFRSEDFITFDGYHLTATGQKEFGRILLQADPVFNEIIEQGRIK